MYWFFQVRFHFILQCFPFPFVLFHLKHISAAQPLKLRLCKISDAKTLGRSLGIQAVVDYSWHLLYENTTLFFSFLPLGGISCYGFKSFVKRQSFYSYPIVTHKRIILLIQNCNRLHLSFTKNYDCSCPQRWCSQILYVGSLLYFEALFEGDGNTENKQKHQGNVVLQSKHSFFFSFYLLNVFKLLV